MMRLLVGATLVLVAACGGEPEPKSKAAPAIIEHREIADDHFAILHVEGRTLAVEREARDLCGHRSWCKVMGWKDADFVPRAMPLTDREIDKQTFVLIINRAMSYDQPIWIQ